MYKLKVEGMSCGRCIQHIAEDLKEFDDSIHVTGDVKSKIVNVESDKPLKEIIKVIEATGYQVKGEVE